jgi:site-specific recombinase XerD
MSSHISPAFDNAVEEYMRGYVASRNLAVRSRDEYQTDVVQFLAFVQEKGLQQMTDVKASHLKAYLAELDRQRLRSSSRRRKLTVIRTFFAWLKEAGQIVHNPGQSVRLPQRADPQPRVLSQAEYGRLLKSATAPRDRAIIQLVLQTGVLLSELHRLNLSDLNLPERVVNDSLGTIHIRGSGSRARIVVLNARACRALKAWLGERPEVETDAVFLANRQTRLSERQTQNIVRKYLNLAGIQGATVHALRHTFAVHHLAQGTDADVVQEVLGHQSPESTRVYIPIAKQKQAYYLQKHAL